MSRRTVKETIRCTMGEIEIRLLESLRVELLRASAMIFMVIDYQSEQAGPGE